MQLFKLLLGTRADRGGAHIGVNLGRRGPADAHRIQLVAQVHPIGGDDHTAGGDLGPDLLGGEMGLTLGHSLHLSGDDPGARGLELGNRFSSLFILPVSRLDPRWLRHAGSVGRGKGAPASYLRPDREGGWTRPLPVR